jgi:hypothetical protein
MTASAASDVLVTLILAISTAGVGAAANVAAKSGKLGKAAKLLKKITETIKRTGNRHQVPKKDLGGGAGTTARTGSGARKGGIPEVESPKKKPDETKLREHDNSDKSGGPKKTSETTGAVTNLGRKSVGDNRKIFEELPVDGGMSGAYDHTTGKFILRPSTNKNPLPDGWVTQYGGHSQVLDDLAEATGESLKGTKNRVSGFYIVKEPDGTARFGWNSGQINPGSHGTRGVPPELQSEIKDSVVAALGL